MKVCGINATKFYKSSRLNIKASHTPAAEGRGNVQLFYIKKDLEICKNIHYPQLFNTIVM